MCHRSKNPPVRDGATNSRTDRFAGNKSVTSAESVSVFGDNALQRYTKFITYRKHATRIRNICASRGRIQIDFLVAAAARISLPFVTE